MEQRSSQTARLAQLYAALNECNRAVMDSTREAELFPRVCAAAVKAGQLNMCWIGVVDTRTGAVRAVATFGAGSDYVDGLSVSVLPGDTFAEGPTGIAIRSGEPVWCQDFQNDPRTAPWHRRGKQFGWRASAALPLHCKGTVHACLTLYADSTDSFDAQARQLLVEMARIVSSALDRFEVDAEKRLALAALESYSQRLHGMAIGTAELASALVEARDPYTAGHQHRVAEISRAIATEMDLAPSQIEGIRVAATLHDVGKIGVPIEILVSPAKLTTIQFDMVKTHADLGYEILKKVDFPWPVAEAAWQHHERLDGSGYPRGLRGDDILLEARIIAIADTVEAMSSHRPYRASLGLPKALAEIERGRGTLYDAGAVDACLRVFRERNLTLAR
jgi:putative nucleotidyltransferase with HDIG domain